MAAPNSFAAYKTNVGRSVTKKWREANQISYDGDDWGDDDEYDEPAAVSPDNGVHQHWGPQPNVSSNRSVTNPSPSRLRGRTSFDRGDDRRAFSSSTGGFNSPYPTTQRAPFPELEHDFEPSSPNFRDQPPLRVNTQPQGPMPPGMFRPGSRGRQYGPSFDAPFSVPGAFPQQRRSGSSNRPPPGDIFQRHESPMRPDSRGSGASVRQFPPRKASLSQQLPPQTDFTQGSPPVASSQDVDSLNISEDKPIPVFVRPSDIYKRMPQEMEKVRKSQESSRPSIESITGHAREGSVGARSTSSDPRDVTNTISQYIDDPDFTRRLKPTLDPVPERKSEYGFDNILIASDAPIQSSETAADGGSATTTGSSIYTDRPDPVSAASVSRNVSLSETIPEAEPQRSSPVRPTFALPAIGRLSAFGMDFGASTPTTQTETDQTSDQLASRAAADAESAKPEPNIGSDVRGLQHQPSFGYKSIVQQAFDESENPTILSPVSNSSSIDRSNSASTTDISPIIPRRQEPGSTVSDFQSAHPTIPEEPSQSDSRPTSTATVRPGEAQELEDDDFAPSGPLRTGYRRDVTPPSVDNSPAKRPLSVEVAASPQPQHGAMVVEQEHETKHEGSTYGRTLDDKPLPAEPTERVDDHDQTSDHDVPSEESLKAEVEHEWEAQKEQFNAQKDLPDSGPATSDMPAPMQRSETPAKGSVRDLAGKLETLSGRSTPNNITTNQPPVEDRPQPQSRLESFRPSLPGGWQSYTSTAASVTPASTNTPVQQSSESPLVQPRPPFAPTHGDSTESIPVARAPVNPAMEKDSITHRAFAAAASAGNALADSLSGRHTVEDVHTPREASEGSSENEWDASSTSSNEKPEAGSLNNRETVQDQQEEYGTVAETPVVAVPGELASSLPSSDVSAAETPSNADQQEADETYSNVDSYFPAPLRMTRGDAPVTRPQIPEVTVPEQSPSESDNERLQLEIERSLTPKSSNLAEANEHRVLQTEGSVVATEPPGFQGTSIDLGKMQSEHGDQVQKEAVHMPDRSTPNAAINPAPQLDGEQGPSTAGRPFLQQRFSWETQTDQTPPPVTPKQMSPQSTNSPDTLRIASQTGSPPVNTYRPDEDLGRSIEPESISQARTPLSPEPSTLTETDGPAFQASRQSQPEPASLRAIMSLQTPQERIRAYNETRHFLAVPDGQLQEWLLSLKTAEHAELFALNGRISQDNADPALSHKPSPRRIFTESAPARHVQEDGKKLMAAAGRFGGKAGVAAKGLFAKGKEKMRHASSGEKVAH
ncbi:hypothetical protein A1O1_00187 [Capronia coronata CBS 617.96]|uniref:Uncharacterized protein n=1 Tax=Capronia coronata CBS 617.96 TaxID=1182541 RepID=W9ZKN4_9EURO|nr:uncharacterized protein A1O1_00187 [Capronia coronata CBS 617.96]EXJ95069.1 hypothetical protein A1O1_00187 [Capronia coronata CBS 617.96]